MTNEWRLTVADVVKRPLFQHAEVVAGSRGLSRSVRWVHVLEAAHTVQYLNGDELILSTGLGFGEAKEKRLAYLSELISRKAVGLCIELGDYIPQVPQDMLELADHHDFPLIVFHKPVRFVDITLDLHEHLINRQMQALRNLETYSRSLQQLSLQTQGIPKLLQHFQASVHTQVFFFPLDGNPLYVPPLPQVVQSELSGLMRTALPQGDDSVSSSGIIALSDKKKLVYQPIIVMGHLLAYVGLILYDREADEYLLLTLDYTVSSMAQILMRKMFAKEQMLAAENRLFDDLIANRPLPEEQIRSLLGLSGKNKTPAYYTLLLSLHRSTEDLSSPLAPHELTGVFRSLLTRLGFRPFIRCKGNRFYLLLIAPTNQTDIRRTLDKAMSEMKRMCRQAMGPDTEVLFGVSRPGERLSEAGRHLAESEQALIFQQDAHSPYFAELGLFRLLFHVPQEPVLTHFIDDYLGPLLRYDAENGTQLAQTLRVYLDHNLSKQETADHLFIHRQTLYHRLEKIQEHLPVDFTHPNERLCLEIALRAHEWKHGLKYHTPPNKAQDKTARPPR
ncbi:PucR family transcriptional regulator [Brevibacillus borstelensis]|uniref:PucR family transcriptional regulator n=1 Tax=Brevibacillus borstelensis TaxID=45462 RepID=UPI000469B1E9|nr:PucR family transcriptional regulator ligand-binding domain-containing protein [Brevibacillus borstelensis]KKX53835.1 transcriptional regulator [Brevibacillus borstelensis cifa_chp40]MCC0563755.1 PucR family transcriptional regulator [Brevibacillus borstelensis]MCM3469546.1 PucR family transcriptional regulator [Brevibacillus borstelensis]MCM3559241.1 PucR family transcriptional regulator [Brevibacillus borstelensis]MCM3589322.1 PucR family transcriptional regulator [Brevibacillus borstelen